MTKETFEKKLAAEIVAKDKTRKLPDSDYLSDHLSYIENEARQARKAYGDWIVSLAILENLQQSLLRAIELARKLANNP